jgi:N-acetylmuramoyl-L-alanine amidase
VVNIAQKRCFEDHSKRHQNPLIMRTLLALAVMVMLGTATPAQARRSGPARTQAINLVVIHSTGGPTCDAATGKPIWVGAGTMADNIAVIEAHPTLGIHHMIDRDGTVRASVPEGQVAHHVLGHSGRSIAVELINDGDGRDPFPPAQLTALVQLLRDIQARHGIQRDGIKRHADLDTRRMPCDTSRRRKVDPGDAYPHDAVLDRVFQR